MWIRRFSLVARRWWFIKRTPCKTYRQAADFNRKWKTWNMKGCTIKYYYLVCFVFLGTNLHKFYKCSWTCLKKKKKLNYMAGITCDIPCTYKINNFYKKNTSKYQKYGMWLWPPPESRGPKNFNFSCTALLIRRNGRVCRNCCSLAIENCTVGSMKGRWNSPRATVT